MADSKLSQISSPVETTPPPSKIYSAFAITNMKSVILVTLDNDINLRLSWFAMFQVQDRVHNILDHIISPTDTKAQ